MIDETIIEAPKSDFFIKLASEADMPKAFADFYRQDRYDQLQWVTVSERVDLWQYEMTDAEFERYEEVIEDTHYFFDEGDEFAHILSSFPSTDCKYSVEGKIVTGYTPAVIEPELDADGNQVKIEIVSEPYLVTHTHDYAIDVVGIIHEPTGNMLTDDEGNEYPETAPVDGWHVNVRLVGDAMRETVEALDALYGVVPNSPSRVFL